MFRFQSQSECQLSKARPTKNTPAARQTSRKNDAREHMKKPRVHSAPRGFIVSCQLGTASFASSHLKGESSAALLASIDTRRKVMTSWPYCVLIDIPAGT